jgi:hypothetical protein
MGRRTGDAHLVAVDGGFKLVTAGVVDLVWLAKSVAEERKAYADARKPDTKHRLLRVSNQTPHSPTSATLWENRTAATLHPVSVVAGI